MLCSVVYSRSHVLQRKIVPIGNSTIVMLSVVTGESVLFVVCKVFVDVCITAVVGTVFVFCFCVSLFRAVSFHYKEKLNS
jgi:hypothetical protein